MDIQQAIAKVIEGQSLDRAEMANVMRMVMGGSATDAQIGGFLVALRMKGESVAEITGAAEVMRELATPVVIDHPNLVDIVGTGGDGSSIFNVSTASSMIVAAAGGKVAKHGNRSVSSKSGAADLLEAAGVNLDINPEQIVRCVNELGVGFMFAVNHHSAMKHAIGPRKELATRTIFNILGPLTNPAGAKKQLLGVYSKDLLRPVAEVLRDLGSEHVLVVHSEDGLDEISIADKTHIVELHNGDIREYSVEPQQFGMQRQSLESLVVENAQQSLALVKLALTGNHPIAGNMLALNAGAALYAADVAGNLQQGVEQALDIIGSGTAWEKLNTLAEFTQLMKS